MIKRMLFLVFIALLTVNSANAQYKVNKTKYDYKTWELQPGDPYNPALVGVVNFLIPGVGHMVAGETGRGFAFLGGFAGSYILYNVGAAKAVSAINEADASGATYEGDGAGLMLLGLASMIVVDIWSIVDGVRVAKVNNLAFRDKHKIGSSIKLNPAFISVKTFNNYQNALGVKLALSF